MPKEKDGKIYLNKEDLIQGLFQQDELNLLDSVWFEKDQPEKVKEIHSIKVVISTDLFVKKHAGYHMGVLFIEMVMQTALSAAPHFFKTDKKPAPCVFGPTKIRKPILAGDELVINCYMRQRRPGMYFIHGDITRENEVVVEVGECHVMPLP